MNRYKEGASLFILSFLLFFGATGVFAQYLQDGVNYAPNRIVVAFQTDLVPIAPVTQNGIFIVGIDEIDALNRQFVVTAMRPLFPSAEKQRELALAGYYSLTFQSASSLEQVLAAYDALALVEHVEPVGIHRVNYTPNDPYLSTQWAITKIDARQAWDLTRGDPDVPLGIADTGVDWDHPDLDGNIWLNTADPIDGSDNDGNGYVDDYRGWDWVTGVNGYPGEDDNTPDNNPMDFNGHGTHVSGIASAETDNSTGIAGLGFDCSIMCLRIGWQDVDGNGYVAMDFAASAMYYAGDMGARAINCSWGSSNSGGLGSAVTYAANHGVVIVSAAGNENSNVAPYLCTRSDVIAVAATDQSDHRASFSNYGSWVDVSAPGVNIRSTYFNNTYAYLDGTSMAAPHVTGLVGLIRSIAPNMTRAQTQARVISTTEDIDALNPGYENLLGSGRINAFNAVNGLGGSLPAPIPVSPPNESYINDATPLFIWIDTSTANIYHFQADQSSNFSSPDINDSSITDTSFTPFSNMAGGTWFWRVKAGNGTVWSEYCTAMNFYLDSQAPNTPVLTAPSPGSWVFDRTPVFSWQPVSDPGGSGIAVYLIQIDNDSTFNQPYLLSDSTTGVNLIPQSDLPADTRIFWRVRARDFAGNLGNYATSSFGIDITAPGPPISFDALPNDWSSNPNFTLNWTNPSDLSGIVMALYKIGTAPTSNSDTTGHFDGTPPATYVFSATDSVTIYVWLKDVAGNTSFLQRAQDIMKYDGTAPSGCATVSPNITSSLNFPVSWSTGSDIGSGLSGLYDIRVKDGAEGTWGDWLTDVAELFHIYAGENGHTYYFEARTTDLVGNNEPFTGTAESQTTVDTSYVGPPYLPGDANGSNDVNGLDVVYLVNYLKGGPPPPDPILRGDANGSCSVNGIDVTYLVNYLKGGPPPFLGDCRR